MAKKAKVKEVAKRAKVAKAKTPMKCVGPVASPVTCHVTVGGSDKLKHQQSRALQILTLPRPLPR